MRALNCGSGACSVCIVSCSVRSAGNGLDHDNFSLSENYVVNGRRCAKITLRHAKTGPCGVCFHCSLVNHVRYRIVPRLHSELTCQSRVWVIKAKLPWNSLLRITRFVTYPYPSYLRPCCTRREKKRNTPTGSAMMNDTDDSLLETQLPESRVLIVITGTIYRRFTQPGNKY